MLVANVAEPVIPRQSRVIDFATNRRCLPVDLARILEQPQRNTVHRSITPSLIEESTSAVQMIEVILIRLAAVEIQIPNLEVAPEVASAVSIRFDIMLRPPDAVGQPVHRVVLMQVF